MGSGRYMYIYKQNASFRSDHKNFLVEITLLVYCCNQLLGEDKGPEDLSVIIIARSPLGMPGRDTNLGASLPPAIEQTTKTHLIPTV